MKVKELAKRKISKKNAKKSERNLPLIRDWEFVFKYGLNIAKCREILDDFVTFEKDRDGSLNIPRGTCFIKGKVFGHDGFSDGDKIITSHIKTIEAIGECCGGLLVATTKSGSRYYFWPDECGANMFMVLGDLRQKHSS